MLRPPSALEGAPLPELQRQPAGFDLTVRSVSRFAMQGALDLTNARRELPELRELAWQPASPEPGSPGLGAAQSGSLLLLKPGGYMVSYNEVVEVPLDSAGIVLPRSSLLRCGATLHSALWDPGYRGRGVGLLTVAHPLCLYRDARIGQLILLRLEEAAALGYAGQYQGEGT